MRFFLTIVLALVVSMIAGSTLGVVVADYLKGDETYILVFMAVPLIALIAVLFFLIASLRPIPAQSVGRVAKFLIGLLLVFLLAMSGLELISTGTVSAAWPGLVLMATIVGCCIVTVVVQWAIFRWRVRPAAPPPPRFGRQAEGSDV